MRLLIEQDDGTIIPARKIETGKQNANLLIVVISSGISRKEEKELEAILEEKSGKKAVVLSGMDAKVIEI